MAITDLTNTRWILNTDLLRPAYTSSTSYNYWYLSFTSTNTGDEWTRMRWRCNSAGDMIYLQYSGVNDQIVYQKQAGGTGWIDNQWKLIEITGGTDATNADVIAWFEANATLVSSTCVVTYVVQNGTWADGTTAPKTETVAGGGSPAAIPTGMIPDPDYYNGAWDTDPNGAIITQNTTFTYTFVQRPITYVTVTYTVVNGTWSDGTTAPKTEQVRTGGVPSDIPEGMIPDTGYDEGAWSPNPSGYPVDTDTTFTYTFSLIVNYTVTYNVSHGTWADGTTTPIAETVRSGRTPSQIPQGMLPDTDYTGGAWYPNPYATIISGDTSFTYTFSPVQPVIYSVYYGIQNGTWADGTKYPKYETVQEGNVPTMIPTGMIPDDGYAGGAWNIDPYTTPINDTTIFTYSFEEIVTPKVTVTYEIVNGKWYDGSKTPKTETVGEGSSPARIPTDMIPTWGYGDGSWSPDPYGAIVTIDTTYTYTFIELPEPGPKPAIPRMAKVIPYYRLRSGNQTSEWIQKGEYYINTRYTTSNFDNLNVMEAQCFDNMIKANAVYRDIAPFIPGEFPTTDMQMVQKVCDLLGFEQDPRNIDVINRGYMVDLPPKYRSCRDVLGSIAALYGANCIFTDEGKLRFIPLVSMGDSLNIRKNANNIIESPKRHGYTKVVFKSQYYTGEERIVYHGVSDDNVIEAVCLWPDRDALKIVYNQLQNWEYRPMTAQGVWSDPAIELGDSVGVGNTRSVNNFTAHSRTLDFSSGTVMELSAPNDEYIDNEYLFESPEKTQIKEITDTVDEVDEKVDEITDEITQITERYPKDGWNTWTVYGSELLGSDWKCIQDLTSGVADAGHYSIEADINEYENTEDNVLRGVAIAVTTGKRLPWTLAGTSWVFWEEPFFPVMYDWSDEMLFYLQFDFLHTDPNATGNPIKQYKGQGIGVILETDPVDGSKFVSAIKYHYGTNLSDPDNPSFTIYTHGSGWDERNSRIIQFIYGGMDDKNEGLVRLICGQSDRKTHCTSWVWNKNLYQVDSWRSADIFGHTIAFTCGGDKNTLYNGILVDVYTNGVREIRYMSSADNTWITVWDGNEWADEKYRYIDFGELQTESDFYSNVYNDFVLMLANYADPNYGMYGSRWSFNNEITYSGGVNKSGFFYTAHENTWGKDEAFAYMHMGSRNNLLYVPFAMDDSYVGVWDNNGWVDSKYKLIEIGYDKQNTQLYYGVENEWLAFLETNAKQVKAQEEGHPPIILEDGNRVRLVAKTEIDSSFIDQDYIEKLSASCVTNLKRDSAIKVYGKTAYEYSCVAELRIHGPMA